MAGRVRCVVDKCRSFASFGDLCSRHHLRWKDAIADGLPAPMPADISIVIDPLPTLRLTQQVVDCAVRMRTELNSYEEIAQRLSTWTGVGWTPGAAKHLVAQAVNCLSDRMRGVVA